MCTAINLCQMKLGVDFWHAVEFSRNGRFLQNRHRSLQALASFTTLAAIPGLSQIRLPEQTKGFRRPNTLPGQPGEHYSSAPARSKRRRGGSRRSGVRGEAQVDAAVARVEPARGDGLAAGEEVDAVGAVGVAVAEEGRLPAAEGVVGDRDRD